MRTQTEPCSPPFFFFLRRRATCYALRSERRPSALLCRAIQRLLLRQRCWLRCGAALCRQRAVLIRRRRLYESAASGFSAAARYARLLDAARYGCLRVLHTSAFCRGALCERAVLRVLYDEHPHHHIYACQQSCGTPTSICSFDADAMPPPV